MTPISIAQARDTLSDRKNSVAHPLLLDQFR